MSVVFILLVAAAVFGLCFAVDKLFTKLFRSRAQHRSGMAVRASKRYGAFGVILMVLGVAALLVWMLTSICGAESFGLPHAAPFSPWQRGAVRDGLMRWPWPALADHPFTVRAVKRGGGPHR